MSVLYAGELGATAAAEPADVRARRGLAAAAGLLGLLTGTATAVLHLFDGALPFTGWWTGTTTIALATGGLGWLVAARAPGNPIGWLMCAAGVANGLCGLGREYLAWSLTQEHLPAAIWVGAFADSVYVVSMATLPAVLMLFPDGRPLPGRWWRAALIAVPVFGTAAWLGVLFSPDPQQIAGRPFDNPLAVLPTPFASAYNAFNSLTFALVAAVAIASLAVRYRRAEPGTRRRLVWVAWAGAILLLEEALELLPAYRIGPLLGPLTEVLFVGTIAVGIVRHRLFDVDLVVNRALVYVTVSGLLLAGYLGVVTVVTRLGVGQGVGGPLIGTALVAVAFAPLRSRLQRGVDRLLYGERGDPYGVMSSLSRQLDRIDQPGGELDVVLDVVTGSLRLPYAAVRGGDGTLLAETGRPRAELVERPLTHRGELLGVLQVCPRPGGPLGSGDLRLLGDLARQTGALVHALELAGQLQESRRRLVTAKEEERRRLRRDLHDGLGPELAALTLKVDGAALQLASRPERAAQLLADVRAGLGSTIGDIRRLVYDLRPPALDELGLLGALRDFVRRLDTAEGGQPVCTVDAPESWPALPAAVEVAAYRIATEAVTNVFRHAHARRCEVRLAAREDRLLLEIVDDGTGLPDPPRVGVGTRSIAERAAEIGGRASIVRRSDRPGTIVRAELPLAVEERP
jgi:signal transduction histidine kinase